MTSNRAANVAANIFVQLYQKFVKLHTKNAFDEIVLIIPEIPITLLSDNYAPHYTSLLSSCLSAVARCTIAVQPAWTQHLCAAFAHLFTMQPTLQKLCATVGDLDRCRGQFAALAVHGICTKMADSILTRLEALLAERPAIDGHLDAQHVAIYRCLLVLLRLEMAAEPADPTSITKATQTLLAVAALKRGAGKLSEFRKSLNILLLLLLVCQHEGSAAVLVAWTRRWKLPAEIPADFADDLQLNTLLTAVQMLGTVRLSARLDAAESTNLLRFLLAAQTALLACLPHAISFPRISCYHCKSNAIRHECIATGDLAARIIRTKLASVPPSNEDDRPALIAEFGVIFRRSVGAARSLQCPNSAYVLDRAMRIVLALPGDLKHHQLPPAVTWDWLCRLCSAADQLGISTITDILSVHRLSTELLAVAPTTEDALIVNYIHLSHLLGQPDYPSLAVEQRTAVVLQRICALQNTLVDVFDIDAHLAGLGYVWHGLPVPWPPAADAAGADLLLQLFQFAVRRPVLLPALRQQLMELIVRTVPADRPLQALRVANGFLGYALTSTTLHAGLAAAYSRAKRHQVEYARHSLLKRRWYAAVANMETIEYLQLTEAQHTRLAAEPPTDLRHPADCTLFRREVNLRQEQQLLRRVQLALRWYGKFVAKLTDTEADRVLFAAETWNALEALNQLGEHCALRNYRPEAWHAYQLLLQLARKAEPEPVAAGGGADPGRGTLGRVQAITHLAWHRADCAPTEPGETVAQALQRLHADVAQCDEELTAMLALGDTLSRRRRGAALNCLLAVARYRADTPTGNGGLTESLDLLRLSEQLLEELEQQFEMPECNVYRIRYYAVLLRLITHHGLVVPSPPILFAETMLRMCHRLYFHNGDGVTRFKCLLFEFMADVTEYCVARFDFGEVLTVLQMLLKMAVRDALACTAGRLLALWTHVELWKENAGDAEAVLGLLDDCLAVFDAGGGDSVSQEAELVGGIQKLSVAAPVAVSGGGALSPVRNAGRPQRISPIREFHRGINIPTNKYLIDHPDACECPVCRTPFGPLLLYDVAVLHCRLLYVKGDFDQALNTFEQTFAHYGQRHTSTEAAVGSATAAHQLALIGCRLCSYYALSLWRAGQPDRAAVQLRSALVRIERSAHPDKAIVQQLYAQLTALDFRQRTTAVAHKVFAIDADTVLQRLCGTATATAGTKTREPTKIAQPVVVQKNGRTVKAPTTAKTTTKAPTIQVYLSDSDSDMDITESDSRKPSTASKHPNRKLEIVASRSTTQAAENVPAPAGTKRSPAFGVLAVPKSGHPSGSPAVRPTTENGKPEHISRAMRPTNENGTSKSTAATRSPAARQRKRAHAVPKTGTIADPDRKAPPARMTRAMRALMTENRPA